MNSERPKGFVQPHHSKLQVLARTIDLALVMASLYVSLILYNIPLDREYFLPCVITTALFGILAESNELYQNWRGSSLFDEAMNIFFSWLGAFTLVISGTYLYGTEYTYSLQAIELWIPLAPTCIILTHTIQRVSLSYLRKQGFNTRFYAILGANSLGLRLHTALSDMPWLGYNFVGFFDDRIEAVDRRLLQSQIGDLKGGFEQLLEKAKQGEIDHI